jgi:hypothetical protein
VSDALLRIKDMTIRHYRDSADFERAQKDGLARVLWDLIIALDVPHVIREEIEPGAALVFGMYRPADIVAAAKRTPEPRGFSMFGLERILAPSLIATVLVLAVIRRIRHPRGPL